MGEESVIIYPKVDMWEASVFDYTYNRSGRKVLTRNRRAVKPWRVQRDGMFIYSESNKNLGSKKDNPFGGYTTAGHLLFDLGSIDKMVVGKVLLHLFRIQINDQRPGFHTKKKKVQLRIHNFGGKHFSTMKHCILSVVAQPGQELKLSSWKILILLMSG